MPCSFTLLHRSAKLRDGEGLQIIQPCTMAAYTVYTQNVLIPVTANCVSFCQLLLFLSVLIKGWVLGWLWAPSQACHTPCLPCALTESRAEEALILVIQPRKQIIIWVHLKSANPPKHMGVKRLLVSDLITLGMPHMRCCSQHLSGLTANQARGTLNRFCAALANDSDKGGPQPGRGASTSPPLHQYHSYTTHINITPTPLHQYHSYTTHTRTHTHLLLHVSIQEWIMEMWEEGYYITTSSSISPTHYTHTSCCMCQFRSGSWRSGRKVTT